MKKEVTYDYLITITDSDPTFEYSSGSIFRIMFSVKGIHFKGLFTDSIHGIYSITPVEPRLLLDHLYSIAGKEMQE